MIAEFARRHNPVLKAQFDRIKNGNKKRHRLAVIAIANKIARYIYYKSSFIITYESLMRLSEVTRNTFFQNITTKFSKRIRRQIYQYSDVNGEIHQFVYIQNKDIEI